MAFSLQIYLYLLFVGAEAVLYFYMATTYQKRMLDYSWDNHVAIEKYIVTALWVAGIFYSVLSFSNIYTVMTFTTPYAFHAAISLFNSAKRVLTLGVTLILSSGRRLSAPLAAAGVCYFVAYIWISESLRNAAKQMHETGLFAKVWPTSVDIVLLGYAWFELRKTIRHVEESQQARKLKRYCWFSLLLTFVFLALCLKQILSLMGMGAGAFTVELDQLTYFALLAGIGALWWPSPANRDYENVVEIHATSTEVERETPLFAEGASNELELQIDYRPNDDPSPV